MRILAAALLTAFSGREWRGTPGHTEAATEVRAAGVKGMGAFAAQPIKEGVWCCRYIGDLVSTGAAPEAATFDPLNLLSAAASAAASAPSADSASEYLLSLTPELALDGRGSEHVSRYINHDERGNLDCCICARTLRADFYASRDIAAGEELTYDYGLSFWLGRPSPPAEGTDSRDFSVAPPTSFRDWCAARANDSG